MKIYSLSGKSGTGKSYQATELCRKLNIDSIIDDGLFICRNKVEAGTSAKRQKTKIGAVKTALFFTDEHRDQVKAAIEHRAPASILIIGTSDEMVDRIVDRLGLDRPSERIYIDDITTEEERQEADHQRNDLGKHVIPVPTFRLKRQFSGYFLSPLRMIRGIGKTGDVSEKTVVRPAFSYMGRYKISEKVIHDIVRCVRDELEAVADVSHIRIITEQAGIEEGLSIEALVDMNRRPDIKGGTLKLQEKIFNEVEAMTAFQVNRVDLEIRSMSRPDAAADNEEKRGKEN